MRLSVTLLASFFIQFSALGVSFFTDLSQWQGAVTGNVTLDTLNDEANNVFPNPLYIERPQYNYRVAGWVTLDGPSGGIDTIWDVNGTSHYQNNVRSGFPPDVVTFYFDQAISAFGYSVRSAGLESFGSRIDIFTNDGQTGFFNLPLGTGAEFRGMVFPTPVTAVELRAVGSPYATHGADDIRFAPAIVVVPEPESYAVVIGLGLGGICLYRRARRVPRTGISAMVR